MTGLQLTAVFTLALGSWGIMCLAMQKQPTFLRVLVIVLCLAGVVGAFAIGAHWNHTDFTCKPGQHCFPWGD
jgi:hypothetical protein